MFDLTKFQRDVLYVVAGYGDDGVKGLQIKADLEADGYGEVHHGRLYPNLDTLVEKGLVEKGKRDRRTNEYTLTARGARELQARREWEDDRLDGRLAGVEA
jgi:PadR family transcriptional regulator PadR